MLGWVYHVQLTHASPYRRGHPGVTLLTKSLRNTLVRNISGYLTSFVMAVCCKDSLDFIGDDETSERRMLKISVLPPETLWLMKLAAGLEWWREPRRLICRGILKGE